MTTDVRPFRAIRFDPTRSGPVGPLLAPPYDVASAPATTARYSIAGIENVDLGVPGDQHAVAAERYAAWRRVGILHQDPAPAIYLHEHRFPTADGVATRQAFFARVRLVDWEDGGVQPHERTMPGPRQERGARLRTTEANLSPLYFLFRDPNGDVRDLMSSTLASTDTPAEQDQVGGEHRLIPVTDPAFHQVLQQFLAPRALFVADGHHRYEAALAYRNEQRQIYGCDPEAPWEFVLVLLAAAEDPGVIVRPTHRLLLGDGLALGELIDQLRRWFAVTPIQREAPVGADESFIARVVLGEDAGVWDIRVREDRPHLDLLPADRGPAWRALPVAAVEAVLEHAFGPGGEGNGARIRYTIDARDAMTQVVDGHARAAFLLPPPRLAQILAVGAEGDLLPPKSTWFEPKAPAGLVINDLRGDT
ncbi:MAG: DUF1015 domain-containing protein [Thermomicrobiales bacterium]